MVRAKIYVAQVTRHHKLEILTNPPLVTTEGDQTQEDIEFQAVVSGSDENKSFSKYTPSASLKMSITNETLFGYFVQGAEYYLDFTPASVPAAAE